MRPQSEIRICLTAALVDGPGTTRQLAQRTGWAIGMTRKTLLNMVQAGDADSTTRIRQPGVFRPVPVYRRAQRATDAASTSTEHLPDIISLWAASRPAPARPPMPASNSVP